MTNTKTPFDDFFQISKPECQALFADFAVDLESLHDTLTQIENAKSPRIASAILSTISTQLGSPKFHYPKIEFMDSEKLQEARSYVERQLHIFYWHRILELFDIVTLIVDATRFNLEPYTYTYTDKPLTPFTPENVVKLLSDVKEVYSEAAIAKTFAELKDVMKVKTFKNESSEIILDYPTYKSHQVNNAIAHLCMYLVISGNPEWYKQTLQRFYHYPDSMEKSGLMRVDFASKGGEKLKLSKPMAAVFQALYDQMAETA